MNKPIESGVRVPTPAALAMIDRLIAYPTVSRDSNLGLIEYARDYLARLGAKPHLVYDATGKKANLFCTLADEPERVKRGGLILSGHTDTVPVDGQEWRSDPFIASHRDGRVHGRGSADMKGFIALALAWAPRFLAAQEHTPIHLSLTFDEETTFLGVRGLVQDLEERGIKPAGCIIGEPTDLRAIVAHKGKRDWCCAGRRQCDRSRGADHFVHPRAGRANGARRAARRPLRCSVHDAADRCRARRHCRQRRAARL